MRSNQEILEQAYTAFNARDIDAVLAVLHPEVDWPNGMEGGRVHGHAGVRAYWQRQWSMMDPRVLPLRFQEYEAGRVAVEVHQVVRDLNGTLVSDQIVQHLYTLRDNLIQRMDIQKAAN
jgi:hypothetical protein